MEETDKPIESTESKDYNIEKVETPDEPSTMTKVKTGAKRIFRKILLWSLLIVIVGGGGYLAFARWASFSSGTRSGKVIKFSKKGYVFKTAEGEINTGDFAGGMWEFSVYPGDDEIQEEIKDAMEKGYEVNVKYKERFVAIPFWGDTKYFIYDVDKVVP